MTTTGSGADGVFATGTGSAVLVCRVAIDAAGAAAHGIMASAGGTISALDLTVTTAGSNGSPRPRPSRASRSTRPARGR